MVAELRTSKFKKKIFVVNTHLNNNLDNKDEKLADLFAVINSFRGDVKFLCGDLNLAPNTEYYRKIKKIKVRKYYI